MSKSYRIRTTPGVDSNIKINIEQDFDTLDILSLKMTQAEAYTSLCADFGVVVGRVFTNGGYGLPNVRVSIFIPIEDEDEDNPVISELYPYRSSSARNEDGYRYNLLPKVKQHDGHTPTGTFPSKTEVLTQDHVLEVYEKYYQFTAKTNDSGDFMLFGVPLGTHTIHFDLDLSDIGCQSQTPFDLIYQGTSEELFENSYTFMASDNLDSLPQIISTQKTVNVEPFWGNPELCQVGITRSDFDLKERGISIEPYAMFMGGTYTDSERNAVRVRCHVDSEMGEKCSLVTGKGDVEAIRFSGEYETENGVVDARRPILESIQLNSEIDENGNFFVRVPMNLGFVTTDEFGYLVESKDPDVGIPSLGKYRFRLSLQDDSGGKKSYRGKYLVPQLKEHQVNGNGENSSIDGKSYAFSTNIDDYPDDAIDDIIGVNNEFGHPNDYFYSFRYHRLYTVSGFVNQYRKNDGSGFSFRRNRRDSFLGIKEIQPEAQEDCNNNNQYFPITDATSNRKFKFLITIFLTFLEMLFLRITQFVIDVFVEFIYDVSEFIYGIKIGPWRPLKGLANRIAEFGRRLQVATVRNLGLVNYPDCYDCSNDGSETVGITGEYNAFQINVPDEENLKSDFDPTFGSGQGTLLDNNEDSQDDDPDWLLGHRFVENYSDSNEDFDLYFMAYYSNPIEGQNTNRGLIPSSGIVLNSQTNYVFKVLLKDPALAPKRWGYYAVGPGTSHPFDTSPNGENPTKILGLYLSIMEDILDENNEDDDNYDWVDDKTAHGLNQIVAVYQIWANDTGYYPEGTPPEGINNAEAGCEKYDVLYDHNGNMDLHAFVNTTNNSDEDVYIDYRDTNPNGFVEFPDVFIDTEDPCTYEPPSYGIISSVSKKDVENDSISDLRSRRLCYGTYNNGTASGYSEFRNGVYTLIAAAGKNQQLIGDYYRRKRLGSLLCAGYISYGFFNSWLNGSLYFFQFRRRRGGEDAKYCKDLIYRKEDETGVHYYYRSTPYYNGQFTGLSKSDNKEILSPTTVVDLGPRNSFINQICTDVNLDVNCSVSRSLGSTSYQDINDLMEYILMSKEVKEKGKLDAKDLFDKRGNDIIDGDIAQLLNFNSQAGIFGYEDESEDSPYYPEGGAFVYDGVGPVGVDFVYSEDDEDTPQVEMNGALIRLCINGVGNLTETSQDVPYYKWDKKGSGFGDDGDDSEKQNWVKSQIYTTKYQGGWVTDGMLKVDPDSSDEDGQYYYDNDSTSELAYEAYTLPPIRDCDDENYNQEKIPLGGPFFFYFGLRTGKTSWNKFIDKYGPN